ncbi:MAG: hypothetical protein ACI9S8_002470 [Chlamydiales bacterium]|jgi:hypothetical protein
MSTPTSYLQIQNSSSSLYEENPSWFSRCIRTCPPCSISSLCSRVFSTFSNITTEKVKDFVLENKGEILLGIAANGVAYYVGTATDLEPEHIKWQIYSLYGALFTAHSYQLHQSASKEKKLRSLMHTTSAALAITYPVIMELGKLHLGWHHMSIGLLCLVPHYKALSVFGLAMATDEILYYDELHLYTSQADQKKFQDLVGNQGLDDRFVKHFQAIIIGLTVITVLEEVLNYRKRHNTRTREDESAALLLEQFENDTPEVELTAVE